MLVAVALIPHMRKCDYLTPLGALILGAVLIGLAASRSAAADATEVALKAAIGKNVEHAARWLDERDYKSLAQSAGGLAMLVDLLKSKSDDAAWQTATQEVAGKVDALRAAARSEDDAKCQAAIAALRHAAKAADKLTPTGKPLPAPKAPGIRPLMLSMDAIQGDAKVALLTGNVAAAKTQAVVLAELAGLVSSSRSTEKWATYADAFAAACQAAAASNEADTKTIRPLFRAIAERCEACHENARTR